MSTRNLFLAVAGLTLAATILAASPRAPAPPHSILSATLCLAPADSSRVRITWTEAPVTTTPVSRYVWGLDVGPATVAGDTVPVEAPRAVELSVPCPGYGASVVLSARVRAIDALGLAGGVGTAALTLATPEAAPPGAPEVTIDTVALGEPEPAPLGTLEILDVTGGERWVLSVCDGGDCDITWYHDPVQSEPDYAPPGYAVWLVEGDASTVELPVWPESAAPVTMGGVVARPISEGACRYPVLPRGPEETQHTCRVHGVPETGNLSWRVTWSRVSLPTIPAESFAVGLPTVADLRVARTAPTAVAVEWTQVSAGAGVVADYGVRWQTGGEWSPVTAVLGSRAGDPIGYTVLGLTPGAPVIVQVSPFRGRLPDQAIVGLPAEITVTTPVSALVDRWPLALR